MDDNQKLLDALYLGATDAQAFEQAIAMLAARFGCGSSALALFDHQMPLREPVSDDRRARCRIEPPLCGTLWRPRSGACAVLKARTGNGFCDRPLVGRRTQARGVFRTITVHTVSEEALCANLFSENGRLAVIAIHRSKDRE